MISRCTCFNLVLSVIVPVIFTVCPAENIWLLVGELSVITGSCVSAGSLLFPQPANTTVANISNLIFMKVKDKGVFQRQLSTS